MSSRSCENDVIIALRNFCEFTIMSRIVQIFCSPVDFWNTGVFYSVLIYWSLEFKKSYDVHITFSEM